MHRIPRGHETWFEICGRPRTQVISLAFLYGIEIFTLETKLPPYILFLKAHIRIYENEVSNSTFYWFHYSNAKVAVLLSDTEEAVQGKVGDCSFLEVIPYF